jgi:hypothetical protein
MKWGPEHPLAYAMRALLFAAIISAYHAWYRPLDNSPLTTASIILIIIMIIITVNKWKQ